MPASSLPLAQYQPGSSQWQRSLSFRAGHHWQNAGKAKLPRAAKKKRQLKGLWKRNANQCKNRRNVA